MGGASPLRSRLLDKQATGANGEQASVATSMAGQHAEYLNVLDRGAALADNHRRLFESVAKHKDDESHQKPHLDYARSLESSFAAAQNIDGSLKDVSNPQGKLTVEPLTRI